MSDLQPVPAQTDAWQQEYDKLSPRQKDGVRSAFDRYFAQFDVVEFDPEEWLSHFTYRPDWSFHIWIEHGLYLHLGIEVRTVDSYDRTTPRVIGHNYQVTTSFFPPGRRPEDLTDALHRFKAWVRECVRQTEMHEMNEWLRWDNELLNDPHKEDAFRDPPG